MKRIITIIAFVLILFTLVLVTHAESVDSTEKEVVENVSTVVKVSGVAGISVIIVTVVTFFVINFKKFGKSVIMIITAIRTVFSKDGKIENLPDIVNNIKGEIKGYTDDFRAMLAEEQRRYSDIEGKYKEQCAESDKLKQALGIFFLYTKGIEPCVRNELFRLLNGDIPFKDTIEETANEIKEVVVKYKESEEVTPTPCLDNLTK